LIDIKSGCGVVGLRARFGTARKSVKRLTREDLCPASRFVVVVVVVIENDNDNETTTI
jgi:hypothetical protein